MLCEKCNNYFSNNNYEKHHKSCDGVYKKFIKQDFCKHCKISWDKLNINEIHEKANHSRWCHVNPKRNEYSNIFKNIVRKKLNQKRVTSEINKNQSEKIKKAWERGSYKNIDFTKSFKGKKHSEESKNLIREKALQSNHRRLRKGMVLYKNIWLDSSWEFELAKRLDELNIEWIRPNPLKWIDKKGIEHNYFPDFYLVNQDLYLDPKNSAAYENQKEKIEILKEVYPNIKFITTLNDCKNWNLE